MARQGRTLGRLATAALLLVAAGCATGPKEKLIPMFWPGPPETTRIKFLATLASEEEIGQTPGVAKTLRDFVAGKPPVSHLHNPIAVAVSSDGSNIYVSDFAQALVYHFDLAHRKVTLIGKDEKLFDRPGGVALDASGHVYIVDNFGKAVVVLDAHDKLVQKFSDPDFERPLGIAVDPTRGRIYVADTSHQSSQNHNVKVFDTEGHRLGIVGLGKGQAPGAMLFPTFVTVDRAGNLYVGDTMNARVDIFDLNGVFVRTVGERGDASGTFARPKGVALDSFGNLYVADSDWSNVQIFNPKGEALLFFGGRGRYPGLLNNPSGIAIDGDNRIYVADTQNFRVSVYQLVNTKPEDSFVELPDAKQNAEKGGGERTTTGTGARSAPATNTPTGHK